MLASRSVGLFKVDGPDSDGAAVGDVVAPPLLSCAPQGNNWSHYYCRRQWSLAEIVGDSEGSLCSPPCSLNPSAPTSTPRYLGRTSARAAPHHMPTTNRTACTAPVLQDHLRYKHLGSFDRELMELDDR